MASLDTNVLVRWLVADDPAQTAQVHALLEAAHATATQFFVPVTVMLELEWVLRSRYRMDKPTVLLAMNALLETRELQLQAEPALERALHFYRQGRAEFADCLHAGLGADAGQAPLLTFDVQASQLPQAELIRSQ
jgi:predicted nucleic-acid-binding protein